MTTFKIGCISALSLFGLAGCGNPTPDSTQQTNGQVAPSPSQYATPLPGSTPAAETSIFLHCSYIPDGQGSYSLYEAEFKIDPESGTFGTYDGASNTYQNGLFPDYGKGGTNAYSINWNSDNIAEVNDEFIKIYDKEQDYRYWTINRSSGYLTFYTGSVLGLCHLSSNQVKNRAF